MPLSAAVVTVRMLSGFSLQNGYLFRTMDQSKSMPRAAGWVASGLLAGFSAAGCGTISPSSTSPSPAQSALAASSDTFRIEQVVPGVRYVYSWSARGPWAIHLVEVRRPCAPVWQARKAGPPQSQRATTSALAAGALAAINADFFALPQGNTVGAHVSAGSVIASPVARPVVAFTRAGFWLGQARLERPTDARLLAIEHVNRPRADTSQPNLRLFTHWFGAESPRDTVSRALHVRVLPADRGGVIVATDSLGGPYPLDSMHRVVHAPRAMRFRSGDTVRWAVRVVPAEGNAAGRFAQEVVGGFPLLVREGASVLASQPGVRAEFGNQRHPRSAIAFTNEGSVLLILVDGRQAPYSDGMSLPELTDLVLRMGARDALNLDGGGSSALVVQGRVVNRTSDQQGERAVGNALALVRCG
jgi:hypothetical protein